MTLSFKKAVSLLFAGAMAVVGAKAEQARLLRFPAVSDNKIVFCYAGNLYSVDIDGGKAVKLTSDVGYECFPRISPDGKTIAFTAQYDGNTEVWYLRNGTATLYSFTEPPKVARF